MIYTSFWNRPLPEGMVRVAISRGVPKGWDGLREPRLTPASWSMIRLPRDAFNAAFAAQLAESDPEVVYVDLLRMCDGLIPVCCCHEAAVESCHRRLVIPWLRSAGPVEELA